MAALPVALVLALGPPAAGAETVGAVEHFPTKCGVGRLVAGPDGNVWFNCFRESPEFSSRGKALVGRITPAGEVTEYSLPAGIGAGDLTAGPDGNLWFTFDNGGGEYGPTAPSSASAIGRITPTGAVTLFRAGLRAKSRPSEIIAGPEGNLWFADIGKPPMIGRITPQGTISEFATGVQSPLGLGGIAVGAEASVWFTQVYVLPHGDGEPGAVAGRLDPASGTVTPFGDAPAALGAPVAGPGGDIWFADGSDRRDTIDRVTPSGELTRFSQGLAGFPTELVAGPDGNLWFTAQRSIGRVTPDGTITQFNDCMTYRLLFSEARSIVSGPGGDLWFTSATSRQLPSMEEAPTIGRVTPDGTITLFKAGIGLEPQSILAGPDGRVWFSGGNEGIERITPPQAPVNTFIVTPGKVSAKGVAEVPVEVPGPGEVKLRKVVLLLPHKRTANLPGAASLQASPAACGPTALRLRLRGKALARQRRQGSLRVRVTATFTPSGGSPNTRTETTFLRGHRPHRAPRSHRARAAASRVTMAPDDVVGQAAPTEVPNSTLPGAGKFEGPAWKLPVDGIEIGYRQFGKGPDLVMVQGDTAPMSLWMPYLLRPLARHFRVTIFDNRGVGFTTDDLAKPITVPLMARDTGELIEALGLVKPTLVGWSMGGEIGLTVAEQQPSMLGALVSTGGDAGSSHTVPPPPGLVHELANPKASTKVFLGLLFPPTPAGGAATARFVRGFESIPQEKVSPRTLKRQEVAEEAFLRYGGTWDGLPGIATPTLIANGALDPGVPPVNARRLHARIHGSALSIYGGAAHGMLFQDAERFAAQIARFSARAKAAAAAD